MIKTEIKHVCTRCACGRNDHNLAEDESDNTKVKVVKVVHHQCQCRHEDREDREDREERE
jgi:protein-arginine kinase activator protein McsA